ncbi:MAG: hypothetical protein FWB72_05980 [Firmicutes bacterium]|nr:hypothetical protein [Bacillota bacterium]
MGKLVLPKNGGEIASNEMQNVEGGCAPIVTTAKTFQSMLDLASGGWRVDYASVGTSGWFQCKGLDITVTSALSQQGVEDISIMNLRVNGRQIMKFSSLSDSPLYKTDYIQGAKTQIPAGSIVAVGRC